MSESMTRIERFLANPPKRISPGAVRKRKRKTERKYPHDWLTDCFAKQKGKCAYCGTTMRRRIGPGQGRFRATIDHVRPLSVGGRNCRSNIVAACAGCNSEKAASDPARYRALWEKRKEAKYCE